ncbi:CHAT domain-containing protein, partial [Blastomonas sp.]|uniref:CHAT domain-containing protein n=1 Tax=Blastomonas sp. TaxID=1909299 RepID=UPI0035942B48
TDMQALLADGEAYFKVAVVADQVYAQFITKSAVHIYALDLDRPGLDRVVAQLRDSIVREENGVLVTYPFDAALAHQLYLSLMGPIDAELADVRHLVFEPDGAMLQLPPYLLVVEQKGINAYLARSAQPDGDAFDFTGIKWLGRAREMSISVSPRSFADVRVIPASRASKPYLGLGNNAQPPIEVRPIAAVGQSCDWPLSVWQHPIAPDELFLANQIVGGQNGNVVTGQAFSDTSLLARDDLDDYRVLQFATHGLVTAPRPECPARPALVTSFGDGNSDGLLSFREVFDLKLDADVVILSACDTAGMATVGASRDAGITTGGNFALDGLVRAFVGAGARSVVASHWPVPDDFDATKRLIGGMFSAAPGTPLARSLNAAQQGLMDDAATSHPYYWAAFVILGDGQKALLTKPAGQ